MQIQAEACRLLGEQLGVDRAYYVEINEAEGYARVNQDYVRSESPSLVGVYPLTAYGRTVLSLERGETLVVADTETEDILSQAEREAMAGIRIRAHISLSLIKADELVGAFSVTESVARQWSAEEVELVRETAERIWATIQRADAEAALRQSEAKD